MVNALLASQAMKSLLQEAVLNPKLLREILTVKPSKIMSAQSAPLELFSILLESVSPLILHAWLMTKLMDCVLLAILVMISHLKRHASRLNSKKVTLIAKPSQVELVLNVPKDPSLILSESVFSLIPAANPSITEMDHAKLAIQVTKSAEDPVSEVTILILAILSANNS